MVEPTEGGTLFATSQMAEILIEQNLMDEARALIDLMIEKDPTDPRVVSIARRLDEIGAGRDVEQIPAEPTGNTFVSLVESDNALRVSWEVAEQRLTIAKNKVGYSGRAVLRLFSAVFRPRGVRKAFRDIELNHMAASLKLTGLPKPALHLAAVGFLGNTGEFVPVARSTPLDVD